uniref:RGS domain-containing protein n=1 Tax=Meloidogyne hapla TaxID=6305 RepID=A0A1I8B951_MELHA
MFKSLVEISTGELDSSILLSKLFHYATVHGETFMKVIEKFISDLQKSQPDEYFQVTKDQYDFALEKLFKDDQSNRNQIVNPGKSLQHLYKSINNSNILESAVFQPIIYDRSALNKEKYKDILVMREEKLLERWSTAEIGRMALALYTIQGFAHLLYVVWPIAFHVLWKKKIL